jgi:uncharacterized membrane protein YphA (DoxX/SURF4 family)
MLHLYKTGNVPALLCRLAVGLIFLSEGLQKYLFPETLGTGRFEKIGFTIRHSGLISRAHLKLFVEF